MWSGNECEFSLLYEWNIIFIVISGFHNKAEGAYPTSETCHSLRHWPVPLLGHLIECGAWEWCSHWLTCKVDWCHLQKQQNLPPQITLSQLHYLQPSAWIRWSQPMHWLPWCDAIITLGWILSKPLLLCLGLGNYPCQHHIHWSGLRDYQTWCIEFLWVQWFEVLEDHPSGWQHLAFDTARFVLMVEDNTFGFMHPADVLWACHIIPSFTDGMVHPDGIATSSCACDSGDWKHYYVNWCKVCVAGTRVHGWLPLISFLDCDMIMRYHCGLSIGHTYSHAFRPETPEAYPTTCDNINSLSHVPGISICDLPIIGMLLVSEPKFNFRQFWYSATSWWAWRPWWKQFNILRFGFGAGLW